MSQVVPISQIGTDPQHLKDQKLFNLFTAVNGGLDFGTSTQTNSGPGTAYTGNINGSWANVTSPVTPNTEFSVPHNLRDQNGNRPLVPSWYLFISDKACNVYQLPNTGTAWTTVNIYLKCDTASVNLRILVLP